MIMITDTRKANHPALIISLVILVVSFVGVIVFLACCSECPWRHLFHHARAPDDPGRTEPLLRPTRSRRVSAPEPSRPIPIPGAVARPRHRPGETRQLDVPGTSDGSGSIRRPDKEPRSDRLGSVSEEYLRSSSPHVH